MTEKDLKKLSRIDLVEMLLEMSKENMRLQGHLEQAEKKISDRMLIIENAGSLADASMQLNRVFEAAQAAADQYLANIQIRDEELHLRCERIEQETRTKCEQMEQVTVAKCAKMEQATRAKCDQMLNDTNDHCVELEQAARKKREDMIQTARNQVEEYLQMINRRVQDANNAYSWNTVTPDAPANSNK